MDRSDRQKINKGNTDLKWHFRLGELTGYIYRAFHPKETIHMHVHKEHSPGQTKGKATKETSVNFKNLRSYQAFFPDPQQ